MLSTTRAYQGLIASLFMCFFQFWSPVPIQKVDRDTKNAPRQIFPVPLLSH